jgi:hypothetical protein
MTSEVPTTDEPHEGTDTGRWVPMGSVRGVDAPCANCGHQIRISVPHSMRSTRASARTRPRSLHFRLEPRPDYGDPSFCLDCRLEAATADRRAWLRDEYQPLLEAAASAGIPDGAPIWPIYFAADDDDAHKAWRGFRGRFLALQVSGLPENLRDWPNLNSIRFVVGAGEASYGMLIYETAIWHERIAASLIIISHPLHGKTSLEVRNWQQVKRTSDLSRLMRGVELYTEFRASGGRPPGGTTLTKEEFLDELPRAKATVEKRTGRKPIDSELAAAIGVSTPTFRRYKKIFLTDPE